MSLTDAEQKQLRERARHRLKTRLGLAEITRARRGISLAAALRGET